MPVNERYPIAELLDACHYYQQKTKRRITFEWALIRGETDSKETAHSLGKLLKTLNCHVNVIPLNPTAGFGGKATSKEGVDAFCCILENKYGISCTPRTRRGIDIDAGCGQLRADLLEEAAKERDVLMRERGGSVEVDGSLLRESHLSTAEERALLYKDIE